VSIKDTVKRILDLRQRRSEDEEWEGARSDLVKAIQANPEPEELEEALAEDIDDALPVDLKNRIYEQLLSCGGRTAPRLRAYAWHLQLHGPDWDDLACRLLKKADSLAASEASSGIGSDPSRA